MENAGEGPVARWTVPGARLALAADGTVTVSKHDRVVALVRAPFAVNEQGTRFRAWLEASGERLALLTEARGHVLVDPSWTVGVASSVPRWQHTATLLTDGRVLIVGGRQDATALQTQVELFDPARGFVTTNPLTVARAFHTATRLPSGRVLVFGGETGAATWTGTAELYTPSTGHLDHGGYDVDAARASYCDVARRWQRAARRRHRDWRHRPQ